MHVLLIKRADCRRTPVERQVLAARFQFEDADAAAEGSHQTTLPLYDFAPLDLSRLDRHAQTLLDLQQDVQHLPMIALVPKDAVTAQGLAYSTNPLARAVAMPRLAGRIQSMLDSMDCPTHKTYHAGSLTVSPDTGQATFAGKPLALSRREMAALTLLVQHAPNTVPRETLQTRVHGAASGVTSNAIEAVVSRLRRNLKKANCPVRIVALRGVGWCLRGFHDRSEQQR